MIFSQQQFSTAISAVYAAVAKNTTIPVLEFIKIEHINDSAVFTATNLETTIIFKFEVMEEFPTFMLEAKKIIKIIKVLNKVDDISIDIQEEHVLIKQGKDKYQIANYDASDFPMTPESNDFKHLGPFDKRLIRALSKSTHYSGNDELRPVMSGSSIFFDKEAIRIVATDAHRLIEISLAFTPEKDTEYPKNLIIPNTGLGHVLKLMNTTYDIYVSENMIAFKSVDTTILITKVEGKFPNYKAVIPTNNENSFTVNTKEFANALAKASINASLSTHAGKFIISKDQIKIESVDLDFGQSSEIIIDGKVDSEEIMFGLNLNFAQILVKDIENEDLTIQFSTPGRAIIIEEETEESQTLLLLMPIMVE